MKAKTTKNVDRILTEEGHVIDEALKLGVREAALRHKAMGVPMIISKDGEIVSVPADEILRGPAVGGVAARKAAKQVRR